MAGRRPERPEIVDVDGGGIDFGDFQLPWKVLIGGILVIIVGLWFVFGGPVYTVAPQEVGVVQTFGAYSDTVEPGLHFKVPWPVQTVTKVPVQQVKRLEIGFRSIERGNQVSYRDFTDDQQLLREAQMLTGDENVVNASMAVQYRINEPVEWLFNFEYGAVHETLQNLAEAALRQAVGDHPIDAVLTEEKAQIRVEIQERMQELADEYSMGVRITQVQLQDVKPPEQVRGAFQAVASARERREELINRARAYESEQLPRAEGEVQRIRLDAEAYKESQIAEAQGDVARFEAIAREYSAAPDVTRARFYLETMSELLPKVKITVIDEDAGVLNMKSLDRGAVSRGAAASQSAAEPEGQ